MRASRIVGRVVVPALGLLAFAVAAASASCAATPTPVPVRTFDRAQKVAFACLDVNDANGVGLPAVKTAPEAMCPPVAPTVIGSTLAFHYYALVTQATRGELAVVDLTGGGIVDEDTSTPGVNFIPVGAIPTDVVVAPVAALDGPGFTYVSSGDPNSFALYAIDNHRLLGNSTGAPPPPPLQITDLMACALPQRPAAMAIVATPANANGAGGDGGTSGEGGASATPGTCQPNYTIAVLLQAGAGLPAQVMMVDPTPMTCGLQAPGALPPCVPAGASSGASAGLTGPLAATLGGASSTPGPSWPDGVVYADAAAASAVTQAVAGPDAGGAPAGPGADAGVDGATDGAIDDALSAGPVESGDEANAETAALPDAGGTDGATADAMASNDTGPVVGSMASGGPPLSVGPLADPQPTFMVVRDDVPILYVADGAIPLIHVIDASTPSAPVEVSSFVATSQAQPSRRVSVGALALSPPTSQFDPVTGRAVRYLYAIDVNDGTLMVFDATNPVPAPFTPPLVRPHPELNPFAPLDRLAFSAPVAAVTFVRHDWPLFPPNATNALIGYSGLICNPNPNTRSSTGAITDPASYGAYYAADQAAVIEPQGAGVQGFPDRLRGVFAFATLSNGNAVAIDVDDWDAPCRRPDPMDATHQTGILALPQVAPESSDDIDPYHAPTAHPPSAAASWVTQETFFPVSAPNRIRSGFLLRNDPTSGEHTPNLVGPPQLLSAAGAPVAGLGASEPLMLPTALLPGFVDPSYYVTPTDPNDNYGTATPALESADAQGPALADAGSALFPSSNATSGVRVAFDDPTAHIDQDWTVTYEGALPSVSPIEANIQTTDGYQSLLLTVGGPAPDGGANAANARFCGLGIEDWDVGRSRASPALEAMATLGLPVPSLDPAQQLPRWTSDYVEMTDDLLVPGDPYWNTGTTAANGGPGYDCWEGTGLGGDDQAGARYNFCADTYGPYGSEADSHLARDFPIAQAYDGSLVIGRFGFPSGAGMQEQTTNRTVVGKDPSNVLFLKPAACCFHHQAGFKVRTGGEWVAVGQNGLGLLHHIVADDSTGRCVPSTDTHDALLNARAFDVPYFDSVTCSPPSGAVAPIDRTSLLAMRNPMFSYLIWGGCTPLEANEHTTTTRDFSWRFSMRGGFSPLSISLSGGSNLPIVPQSMAFASAFQQLAIVDGSYQGLILIDLNTLAFAHSPYF